MKHTKQHPTTHAGTLLRWGMVSPFLFLTKGEHHVPDHYRLLHHRLRHQSSSSTGVWFVINPIGDTSPHRACVPFLFQGDTNEAHRQRFANKNLPLQ
jgi:hypothetical protein